MQRQVVLLPRLRHVRVVNLHACEAHAGPVLHLGSAGWAGAGDQDAALSTIPMRASVMIPTREAASDHRHPH